MLTRERQQLLLLLFVLCATGLRFAAADTNRQDAAALRSLMKNWKNVPASWGKYDPCAKWDSILCDGNGRVTSLNLFGMSTSGTLSNDIGSLTELRILDLSSNSLDAPLPAVIGKLVKLEYFHFNRNMLEGSIPENLFNSSMHLKHILFDINRFTGPIPASIGVIPTLEVLRLNGNSFTGKVPAFNNLTNLLVLMLSDNKLSGPIPNLTGVHSLENMDISNNSFDPSNVPSWFSGLDNIMTLTMQSVGHSGQLPQKLFSFRQLEHLVLSDNELNGTLDMGSNISTHLDVVDIRNNKISSVTVLEGNPLCNDSLLSDTTPCTGLQTEALPQPVLFDVQCANPFIETVVFRAPSFTNVLEYLPVLEKNLSSQLKSCTPNRIGLTSYSNEVAYLNVDIKACLVNQKKINYSQVLNCFNLTLQTYKPPEKFGPYYVKAHPYPFHDKTSRAVLIGTVTGSVLLIVGLTLVGVYAVRQKKRAQRLVSVSDPFASWGSMGEDIGEAPKLKSARFFTLEELKLYTNDFREINAIGAGGYRKVYRGKLPDSRLVAIKRSKEGSMQGGLEFKTEIELLSRVHHKNLVGLVGFCFEKSEKMLVYEFIPNGTLSEALYGMKGIQLDWSRRLKIALDSARGLAYLHDHANPPIIHRDVKSTNILLDEKMTAKVADFGLSLLVSDSEEGQLCTNVKGTLGYLDPEYYMTQQLTAKSDVYSFGVVLLELIVAKPPIHDNKYIVREVKKALDMEDRKHCGLEDVMDPVLEKMGSLLLGFPRFLKLALQCVEEVGAGRPSMNTIVREIEGATDPLATRERARARERGYHELVATRHAASSEGKDMPEAPVAMREPAAAVAAVLPEAHREGLEYIERVTADAAQVQRRVLAEILAQNAPAEYLRRLGVVGDAPGAVDAFLRAAPLVTYEDILPDVLRIANGDTSPILSGKPIREFLTSSGTSGGERKLMPSIADEMDRRSLMYTLLMPVMSQAVPGLDKGKCMYLYFVKAESRTPAGLPARPVLTSFYRSRHFLERPHDPYTVYTSPDEAILCDDSYQSMYAQLLCGLVHRADVLRVGAVFASGFLRAIRFLEKHWPRLCRDIRAGTLDAEVTDRSVRAAVERVLRADPALADAVEAECARPSWEGIIRRVWPNTKYIDVIVTGAMAQYIPTLEFYGGGLPLTCTMYASSECYFGINLNPMCKPSDVAYTLIPTMGYFEFLPVPSSGGNPAAEPQPRDLVDLVDVKLGHEYELVLTAYSGLYRYRVGDVLRVAGFKNQAPMFNFVRRKNVVLSIDSDKTDEAELHAAVAGAVQHLAPFGASLVEYTSYADAATIPGHYVLFWELRVGGGGATLVPASVFEDCCLAVEEALNSVYRQGRAADRSIGPLEIRVVSEGTFDKLMDYALARGASINQYKAPRCVRSGPLVELLDGRVQARYLSPKCPKWSPGGGRQWNSNAAALPAGAMMRADGNGGGEIIAA